MLKGNKGEWSELYVLLRLLADGRIYAANSQVQKLQNVYFPILKIFREHGWHSQNVEYNISEKVKLINIYLDNKHIGSISREVLSKEARNLYLAMKRQNNSAFSISETENFMKEIYTDKIKAPYNEKKDIAMQVHDIKTGYEPICGFSIKSEIGSAPTLFNASRQTNFQYEVSGLSDSDIREINAIDTNTKVIDRIKAITQRGTIKFRKTLSPTFERNLKMIDSFFPEIIGYILLYRFSSSLRNCRELVSHLEQQDPLHYHSRGLYEFKFKSFLRSVALGMIPSIPWDGRDEANGGYIIVKENGEVLAYHIYNRDSFETYLLNQTKLESVSTSRHNCATLYSENGKTYVNLTLAIRFL